MEAVAALDDGARTRCLSFEFSVPARATGDFALPLALLPAMALGAPLRVEGPVDPGLLERQAGIQQRLAGWSSRFRPIRVDAPEQPPPDRVADGVGAFFSGGLDSFHTVLTRRGELTHLILIHGFDYAPADRDTHRRVAEMAGAVTRELGLEVIEVVTDARQEMLPLVPWGWYHGGLLAGIANALSDHVSRVLIPATHALRHQVPWGQHPELDHLWGTARVEIETAGCERTRLEKAAVVADSDLAMKWLRVCWEHPAEWNCGRCEKCLRTMIDLEVYGALQRCETLPDAVDPDAVRSIVLRSPGKRAYMRESLEGLRRQGGDAELAAAMEVALRRARYRVARERIAQMPDGVAERARHERDRVRMRWRRTSAR